MATDPRGEMQTLNKKSAGGMKPAFCGLGVVAIKYSRHTPPYKVFAGGSVFLLFFCFFVLRAITLNAHAETLSATEQAAQTPHSDPEPPAKVLYTPTYMEHQGGDDR